MHRISLSLVLLLALCSHSLHAQQVPDRNVVRDGGGSIVLGPGDLVRVTVWRQPDLSGEIMIAGDGTLAHPLYRGFRAVGLPLPELEARLREHLVEYEADPRFAVQPLFRVVVGGEVRQPNLYSFPPEVTVAQAVALAGGPTERGRLDRIQLIRGGRLVELDLTAPDAEAESLPVRSGDRIVITRREDPFFRRVIVPLSSVIGAAAAIASVILR